ncbi:MAG: PTS sugar transporter subunit IIC [Clostridia bacterium]|nr:PTS sugar transporter subunit IIC [Clostridia bacterium]
MSQSKVFGKIKFLAKRWFIDAFSGMALGLFATLIAGTILAQIATLVNSGGENAFGNLLGQVATIAKFMMGAGIGAGIAYMLKTDKLTLFSCIVAGMVGANASGWLPDFSVAVSVGNPIGAYLTSLAVAEICQLYAGKTRLDIIFIPIGAMLITCVVAVTLCPPVTWLIEKLGQAIALATDATPFFMGIIIAVAMGVLLTLPTSSAAIWVALAQGISDDAMLLAGGAAVVGCACHMVGFAVMSFKENGWSGLIAQGLGTSMLQIPNVMRNPKILIPPVVASAVCGPLSTCLFALRCGAAGGGMGTAGLVGVFGTIECSTMISPFMLTLGIALLFFVLPAVICWPLTILLKKIGWIGQDDLKLQL